MKKIFSLLLVLLASIIQGKAEETSPPSSTDILLEYSQINEPSDRHRAALPKNIHAWYNPTLQTLDIMYAGESEGETFLYMNDNLVDYAPEINTSFRLAACGLYKIVIVTKNWVAIGYFIL